MKKTKLKEYSFYNNYNSNLNIAVISDIHFNKYVLDRTIKIFQYLCKQDIKYLLIPGDILDYYDVLKDKDVYETIMYCFKMISDNDIKILLILGNHDMFINKRKNKKNPDGFNSEFYNTIKKMKNVYVLNNNVYSDKKIDVVGISLPIEYYKKHENKEVLISTLKNVEKDIKKLDNNGKIKLMLVHSPQYINDDDVKKYTKRYDTIFCGHQHNGCIPIIIDDISKGNRGIYGAYHNFFPKNARGIIDNKIISCGALNFVRPKNLLYKFINLFFPMHIAFINYIKSDKNEVIFKQKYIQKELDKD